MIRLGEKGCATTAYPPKVVWVCKGLLTVLNTRDLHPDQAGLVAHFLANWQHTAPHTAPKVRNAIAYFPQQHTRHISHQTRCSGGDKA